MATVAGFVDIVAIAVGVAARVVCRGAQGLDGRARLLADPFEEHDFDGREVPGGLRVVALGDALPVAAVEQVVAHDPARALAVGSPGRVAVGVGALGPGGWLPRGVVGVLGEAGVPRVVGEGGVPRRAQAVDFVQGGGAGGAGAGRRVPCVAAGGVAGTAGGVAARGLGGGGRRGCGRRVVDLAGWYNCGGSWGGRDGCGYDDWGRRFGNGGRSCCRGYDAHTLLSYRARPRVITTLGMGVVCLDRDDGRG